MGLRSLFRSEPGPWLSRPGGFWKPTPDFSLNLQMNALLCVRGFGLSRCSKRPPQDLPGAAPLARPPVAGWAGRGKARGLTHK